ncbi:uncharacterized protein LOC117819776 [Notolabrus celidotus]|uniref:uncharacterized protein LOC117819776 n=1 Tax=Notolabrus celidotus TaxID=1203425 RepID=UPI00148FAF45|nr:uncharacterized protein LOC117819776 [Notolabrus celidotus]
MRNFHNYMNIYKTFPLMFYMFSMFLPTDGKTIIAKPDRTVNLPCNNKSISDLTQLMWKMNGDHHLFSFKPKQLLHISPEARNLSISMSDSESKLYALVLERAQKFHTGNYTCETTTNTGVWKQDWELIITESADDPENAGNWSKQAIIVATAVPCASILAFIIALTCMLTVCRNHAENPGDMHERTEDIYENCLENRGYNGPSQNKPRAH